MHLRAHSQHAPFQEVVWTATGHERPVFFDEHGRRRRWVLLGGALSGGVSALWLGALIAGAIGFSTMPSLKERSPLLASRATTAHAPAVSVAARRKHGAAHARGSSSPLNGTTELAVSVSR